MLLLLYSFVPMFLLFFCHGSLVTAWQHVASHPLPILPLFLGLSFLCQAPPVSLSID